MRDIKFRAWDGEEMWTVNTLTLISDGTVKAATGHRLQQWHEDDGTDLKVMQYTGLKDKYNEEIYQGDIIVYEDKHNITNDFTEEVIWLEDEYYCGWATESSENVWAEVARQSKVIGNIYENPELCN